MLALLSTPPNDVLYVPLSSQRKLTDDGFGDAGSAGSVKRVVAGDRRGRRSVRPEKYREGLPGYHDPTAGIGGAAPARSALTLRLYLALFGLLSCAALAIVLYAIDAPKGFVVVLVVLAATAVIDIAAVLRRKRRGEPG
jgi:hypothetical protein